MDNETIQQRLTAVRQQFDEWEVDGLLIVHPANRVWLSGFTGSNGMLLITAEQAILATDSRYLERAKSEAPLFTLFPHERTPADDAAFFQSAAVRRLGIEKKHVTLAQAEGWHEMESDMQWVPLQFTVEPLRAIKTAVELDLMRRAAAITDAVMAQLPQIARPGMRESDLAWELEKRLHEGGADSGVAAGVAFPIIVASGPNSALPHHTPGARPLQAGDIIIVDMGARLGGYHSDLTRTFYLGDEPPPEFWRVYNLVNQARQRVFTLLRPDMTIRDADALARDLIAAGGHKAHFGHGLGHGVGLEIHEFPMLSPRAPETAVVSAGMCLTIEPGIYVPGWGGVRLEDLAVLTTAGLEPMSHAPFQPTIPAAS